MDWFESENERAQTVNTERYVAVLRKFWTSLGRRTGFDRDNQWFQQDGATPTHQNHTLDWLRERFQERLIIRKCDVEWAPHSPDLNPQEFYLWGHLYWTMCIRTTLKQLVNSRLLLQLKSGKYPERSACERLAILRNGCESVSNAEEVIWNIFWREHNFCAKHPRLLKLWGITTHRQKSKCSKLE